MRLGCIVAERAYSKELRAFNEAEAHAPRMQSR